MKTKALFLTILSLSAAMSALSFNGVATIGGITYNLVTKAKVATVVSNSGQYKGNLRIPSTVEYEGTVCNVTGIGNEAFKNCSELWSIVIPGSVTTIGESAFEACTSLSIIKFEDEGLLSIGEGAFYLCTSLSSISLPSSLTAIPPGAFVGCSSLTSVFIPNSVTSIGLGAFGRCTSLTSLTIPESVTSLGEAVFLGCTSLTSIPMGKGIKVIPKNAFSGCTALNYVAIPEGIETIDEYAFNECWNISELYFPSSLTDIESNAFDALPNLITLDITDVGNWAQIYFPDYNRNPVAWAQYVSVNGMDLTNLVIPSGVKEIQESTFPICRELKSITIPSSVTKIDGNAFYWGPKLTTVVLGSGVESIGSNAFGKCEELTDVYCYALTPPEQMYAFKDSYVNYAKLHVPSSVVTKYRNNEYWGTFGEVVAITDNDPKADMPQCAKPTIRYINGNEIFFDCSTPGVEFQSMIVDSDIGGHVGKELYVTATYTVKVMAIREGYAPSDVTIAEINWLESQPDVEADDLRGDVNGDGVVDVADIASVISVMAGSAEELRQSADVNDDGTVDVADIATVISIMASN